MGIPRWFWLTGLWITNDYIIFLWSCKHVQVVFVRRLARIVHFFFAGACVHDRVIPAYSILSYSPRFVKGMRLPREIWLPGRVLPHPAQLFVKFPSSSDSGFNVLPSHLERIFFELKDKIVIAGRSSTMEFLTIEDDPDCRLCRGISPHMSLNLLNFHLWDFVQVLQPSSFGLLTNMRLTALCWSASCFLQKTICFQLLQKQG